MASFVMCTVEAKDLMSFLLVIDDKADLFL